jgi:hypothetical protein
LGGKGGAPNEILVAVDSSIVNTVLLDERSEPRRIMMFLPLRARLILLVHNGGRAGSRTWVRSPQAHRSAVFWLVALRAANRHPRALTYNTLLRACKREAFGVFSPPTRHRHQAPLAQIYSCKIGGRGSEAG